MKKALLSLVLTCIIAIGLFALPAFAESFAFDGAAGSFSVSEDGVITWEGIDGCQVWKAIDGKWAPIDEGYSFGSTPDGEYTLELEVFSQESVDSIASWSGKLICKDGVFSVESAAPDAPDGLVTIGAEPSQSGIAIIPLIIIVSLICFVLFVVAPAIIIPIVIVNSKKKRSQ